LCVFRLSLCVPQPDALFMGRQLVCLLLLCVALLLNCLGSTSSSSSCSFSHPLALLQETGCCVAWRASCCYRRSPDLGQLAWHALTALAHSELLIWSPQAHMSACWCLLACSLSGRWRPISRRTLWCCSCVPRTTLAPSLTIDQRRRNAAAAGRMLLATFGRYCTRRGAGSRLALPLQRQQHGRRTLADCRPARVRSSSALLRLLVCASR
jgi:hypothetical protein